MLRSLYILPFSLSVALAGCSHDASDVATSPTATSPLPIAEATIAPLIPPHVPTSVPAHINSQAENDYANRIAGWSKTLTEGFSAIGPQPTKESIGILSASVNAVWDQRLAAPIVPPPFALADNLLNQGLIEMRSGLRRMELQGPTKDAIQELDAGMGLTSRAFKEASDIVKTKR